MPDLPYQPIDCNYYDELVLLAMRKTRIKIEYADDATGPREISGVIRDLQTRQGEEFLILDDGREIRLDHLLSVDGKQPPKYC